MRTSSLATSMRAMAKYLIAFTSAAMDVTDSQWESLVAARVLWSKKRRLPACTSLPVARQGIAHVLISANGAVADGSYPWAPLLNGGFTVLELPSRDPASSGPRHRQVLSLSPGDYVSSSWSALLILAATCLQKVRPNYALERSVRGWSEQCGRQEAKTRITAAMFLALIWTSASAAGECPTFTGQEWEFTAISSTVFIQDHPTTRALQAVTSL